MEEVMNGYKVKLEDKDYVFSHTDEFKMLEVIGKLVLGYKIRVERV